jgi:hypothetical protein
MLGAPNGQKGNWAALLLTTTLQPRPEVEGLLKRSGIGFRRSTNETLLLCQASGGARIGFLKKATSTGPFARAQLACAGHLESFKTRRNREAIGRLESRIFRSTGGMVSIQARGEEDCHAAVKLLFRNPLWLGFDPNRVVDSRGRYIFSAQDGLVRQHLLARTFLAAAFVRPPNTAPPKGVECARSRREVRSMHNERARLVSDCIAGLFNPRPQPAGARRQNLIRVQSHLDTCREYWVAFRTESSVGWKDVTNRLHNLVQEYGGLLVDDYGVTNGFQEVVYAPWATKLARF